MEVVMGNILQGCVLVGERNNTFTAFSSLTVNSKTAMLESVGVRV
jgi:hypothetical protein